MGGTWERTTLAPTRRGQTSDELARRAHVLRRLTFGPFPGGTEASLDAHPHTADAIEALLAAGPLAFEPPASLDRPYRIGDKVVNDKRLDNAGVIHFWINRMTSDGAGLHERMMWFWHTLFTTSGAMGTDLFLWRQLRKLHHHAMGNLGDLAKELVVDPAMMQFLNGDASQVLDPNENLGRELMELFLMGRDHYTQDDVAAAAQGLAGWTIDWVKSDAVYQDFWRMPETTLLGKTAVFDPHMVVDQILAQEPTARWIVRKLHTFLLGGPADDDLIDRWAADFRASGYEIAPLVEQVVTSDEFLEARWTRPRTGIEWLAPIVRILVPGTDDPDLHFLDPMRLDQLGQLPFFPPNVAGWPDLTQWLSSATGYSRAAYITGLAVNAEELDPNARVDEALARCGIYETSDETLAALRRFDRSTKGDPAVRSAATLKAAILTPEFSLA